MRQALSPRRRFRRWRRRLAPIANAAASACSFAQLYGCVYIISPPLRIEPPPLRHRLQPLPLMMPPAADEATPPRSR